MSRNLFLSIFAAVICGAARADVFEGAPEYFVNPDPAIGSNDYDGMSPTNIPGTAYGPKLWIQNALDLIEDDDGAVVTLAPGVYTNGCTLVGSTSNRVDIVHSNVKLRGTAGHRDDTIILGAFDWESEAAHGRGPKAVRCVYGPGRDKNVIVEGVTLTGGATILTDNTYGRGGGAFGVVLVDCVVSNNAAKRGGGLYQCRAFRCRVVGNFADVRGAGAYYSDLSNSFVARNGGYPTLSDAGLIVNCTIADNPSYVLHESTNLRTYNTLIVNNSYNGFRKASYVSSGSAAYACVALNGLLGATVDEESVTTGFSNYSEIVSPAIGDCRILTTSVSFNRGRGEYVDSDDILPFPEGYEPKDIDGNPVATSGKIHVGCSQTAVVPAGACLAFKQACEVVGYGEFGVHPYRYTSINQYLRPTVTGEVFRLKPVVAEGTTLFALYDYSLGASKSIVHGMYDGTYCFPMRPLKANDAVVTVTPINCTHVFYVDGTNGDDACDGTSPTHESGTVGPKKTINAGVKLHTSTKEYSLVRVAPGRYAETSGVNQAAISLATANLGLVSTVKGGATVCGQKGTSTESGVGAGALRCVSMTGTETFIQGFVLTDGCGPSEETEVAYGGGGVYCGSANPVRQSVLDCVITNCTASVAGAMLRGRALRTAFYGNTALGGSLLWGSDCYSCVFEGNACADHVFDGQSSAYFCSVSGNDCALVSTNALDIVGVVAEDISGTSQPTGVSVGNSIDGCFAAPAAHDFRLGCLSSAYGAVPVTNVWNLGTYVFVTTDFNGDDLLLADGRYTAGAVHNRTPLPCVAFNIPPESAGTTVVGGRTGTNVLTRTDQEFTFVADPARPYLCLRKDGELVTSNVTYFVSAVGMTSGSLVYDVVYGTDWYVDQVGGDDSNTGALPEKAKRKLTTAAGYAIGGDTVHVGPGTYGDEDGTMLQTAPVAGEPATMPSRLWVKPGVTVESDEGPKKTVILGKQTAGATNYGLGVDSVRCAVISEGGRLKGFTLTGGGTRVTTGLNYFDDYTSGGVLGAGRDSATVEDCIISNNCASLSAAGNECRFLRSILVGNRATIRAGCVDTGRFVGCFIDRNLGTYTINHYYEFDSCTLGPNNHSSMKGTGTPSTLFDSHCTVLNSFVLQTSSLGTKGTATNSIFITKSNATKWTLDEKSKFLTLAKALSYLDAADYYRPLLLEGSPFLDTVDAESEALSDADAVGLWDASGSQRTMNGFRDIGAFEADWLENYHQAISTAERFGLAAASPKVRRESPDEGEVRIYDRGVLTPTWTVPSVGSKYRLVVRVTGSGTLTALHGDTVIGTATEADGEKAIVVSALELTDAVRLAYSGDDGYAVLTGAGSTRGLTVYLLEE